MPYIITTRTPAYHPLARDHYVTRRAVATLDEARDAMRERVAEPDALPDGSVVTVEPIRWDDLRARAFAAGAASPLEREIGDNGRPIIDAFNDAVAA